MRTRSATPSASAPPDPPSPMTVAIRTIAVQLDEIGEREPDVIRGERPLPVSGNLHSLERSEVLVNRLAQLGEPPLQRSDLVGGDELAVAGRRALQLIDLSLQLD